MRAWSELAAGFWALGFGARESRCSSSARSLRAIVHDRPFPSLPVHSPFAIRHQPPVTNPSTLVTTIAFMDIISSRGNSNR